MNLRDKITILIVSEDGVVSISEMESVAGREESESLAASYYTVHILIRVLVYCEVGAGQGVRAEDTGNNLTDRLVRRRDRQSRNKNFPSS
jgi:hypothetical protein